MSTVGSFDRSKHLSELADPIDRGSGLVSPATRRQEVLRNLANSATFTIAQLSFLDNVTAGTAAASKALVLDANKGIANFRNLSTPGIFKQAAPAAKTTSTTLTAAELIGGLLTGNQAAGAAATYTLPLATDMETALIAIYPGLQNDDAFEFTLINLSVVAAEDITVAVAAGWTLVGKMTVESNDAVTSDARGTFRARRTGANTYTLYRVG